MKSIRRKFNEVSSKHPYWSSYVVFFATVKEGRFGKKAVRHWFNRLVDKNDYSPVEKRGVVAHLVHSSGMPEEGRKNTPGWLERGVNAQA